MKIGEFILEIKPRITKKQFHTPLLTPDSIPCIPLCVQAKFQIRQGDVLVQSTKIQPSGPIAPREGQRVILAHGEVTGHAHAISEQGAVIRTTEQATLLEVTEAVVMLRHDEHAPIEIPEGVHEVIRQREYTPQAVRNVAD